MIGINVLISNKDSVVNFRSFRAICFVENLLTSAGFKLRSAVQRASTLTTRQLQRPSKKIFLLANFAEQNRFFIFTFWLCKNDEHGQSEKQQKRSNPRHLLFNSNLLTTCCQIIKLVDLFWNFHDIKQKKVDRKNSG